MKKNSHKIKETQESFTMLSMKWTYQLDIKSHDNPTQRKIKRSPQQSLVHNSSEFQPTSICFQFLNLHPVLLPRNELP